MKNSKIFKKLIFISSMAGIGLFVNSCATGYVTTEPSYVEYSRPQRPSELHIWINGNWVYSNQTHTYVQRNGYWAAPNQRRVYISGQWQSTPKGKHWEKGRWEKDSRQKKHKSR